MYVYESVYEYLYVCEIVWVRVCVWDSVSTCMCVQVYVSMGICVRVCMSMCMHVSVCAVWRAIEVSRSVSILWDAELSAEVSYVAIEPHIGSSHLQTSRWSHLATVTLPPDTPKSPPAEPTLRDPPPIWGGWHYNHLASFQCHLFFMIFFIHDPPCSLPYLDVGTLVSCEGLCTGPMTCFQWIRDWSFLWKSWSFVPRISFSMPTAYEYVLAARTIKIECVTILKMLGFPCGSWIPLFYQRLKATLQQALCLAGI